MVDGPQARAQSRGLVPDEQQQEWMRLAKILESRGYSPADVQETVLEHLEHTKETEGGGVMKAARAAYEHPITVSDVLWTVGIVIGVGLFLKLIGLAFNINIPLLHKAEPEMLPVP